MTAQEVLKELESFGDERTKATLMKHGAKEPFFGVKVADLKKILKKTKKNHELSLELYKTGNSDAMYLAALMADETKISKADLQSWVKNAYWSYLCEHSVPWVASESPYAMELALKWIESDTETIASAGWSTLSSYAGVTADEDIDLELYKSLLQRVEKEIHQAKKRVKYTMNGFVIATGSYIAPLSKEAQAVADKIGLLIIDMNGTACKVPPAKVYIQKVVDRGSLGKKRKTARC